MKQSTVWSIVYSLTGIMLIVPCLLMLASIFNPSNALVNSMGIAVMIGWVIFPATICIIVFISMFVRSLLKRSH